MSCELLRRQAQKATEIRLTGSEMKLVMFLFYNTKRRLFVDDIAKAVGLERGSVTSNLASMAKRKIVHRAFRKPGSPVTLNRNTGDWLPR